MIEKKLHIVILGGSGAGKSALAALLERELEGRGATVRNDDHAATGKTDLDLDKVIDGAKITISTIQTE